MKIVFLNCNCVGSTGKIINEIAYLCTQEGNDSISIIPRLYSNKKYDGNDKDYTITHDFCSPLFSSFAERFNRISGTEGLTLFFHTLKLCSYLKREKPDIVHLHNIHSTYIYLPLLFRYIKKHNMQVIWTLHDCWTFTGRCPHFTTLKCERWKTSCHDCPYPRDLYPLACVDHSSFMWKRKHHWFCSMKNVTIVTPSQWLGNLVKQSYLKEYPLKVINNGIDLNVFRPTDSNFREKHGISPDQKMLLGVAFGWGYRKGLDIFLELSKKINKEKYRIVLVGTDDVVNRQLPENIISIYRTQNQKELAEIYSAADLFVNPTREDNYPTVNMEAIACGTPVLTFRTGGSPEIPDGTCGSVVDCDDIDALEKEIIRICEKEPYSKEACLKRAEKFDMNARFDEYIDLYNSVLRKEQKS